MYITSLRKKKPFTVCFTGEGGGCLVQFYFFILKFQRKDWRAPKCPVLGEPSTWDKLEN